MNKQQIIDFAAGFGYEITDRKSAAWVIAHIHNYHGDKTVSQRHVYQAWKSAQ